MLAKPLIHLDVALLHACQQATVITASERIRGALLHAYDAYHVGLGLQTWRSARVVTLGAYLEQRHAELLRSAASDRVLLGAHAQRLAWLEHAPDSAEIDFDAIYDDIATAWQIVHDWDLADRLHQFVDNDNHRLLRDWAGRYSRAAERHRWLTEAELPEFIAAALRSRQLPAESAVFIGFDIVPPGIAHLIEALRSAGGTAQIVERRHAPVTQPTSATSDDPEQELDAAICWARDVLLDAERPVSVGIAVPDVIAQYDRIIRQLESGLRPANRNPDPALCPYNISGGIPLAALPVVSIALQLLHWLIEPLHHSRIEQLLQSPFLSLASIARQSQSSDLPESYDASQLASRFVVPPLRDIVSRARMRRNAATAETLAQMKVILAIAGWPNVGSLTSETFQAYRAFMDLLDELASASSVVRAYTFAETLAIVRDAARRCLFAPVRPNAPLQVLGYLETANLEFTHLWVVGLSDLTWPGPARANVYIPLRLLRGAGVPRVDAESELAFARRLTDHWRRAGQHVVFSSPRVMDEAACRMSRLVDVAPPRPAAAFSHFHPFLIHNQSVVLEIRDEPPVGRIAAEKLRHHGSQILRDQSACPFRAFARYRLHVTPQVLPHSFFDPIERGVATHRALHETYDRIAPRNCRDPLDESQIETIARAAVGSALSDSARFPKPFLAAERKRLVALVLEWLRFEQSRLTSRFIAGERATNLSLGPSTFQLQIDRIDELDGGGALVIDYKTGTADPSAVFGERPEEPQLAMYAISIPNVQAIAFARVKHDDCRIVGWSNPSRTTHGETARHLRPSPRPDLTWDDLLDSWRIGLTHLSDEFTAGVADVSPRNAGACRQCDLHALCRIREFAQPSADDFDR
jgi:probable DNA repair protein